MKAKGIVRVALTAAIYTALTLGLMPISFGIIQLRVSEVLTILPRYSKKYILGLTVGCLLSNYIGMAILGGTGIIDIVFGTLATFIAAVLSYKFRNKKYLVPLFPVILNGLIVGTYLHFLVFTTVNVFLCILSVAIGEALATYALGIPLMNFIDKNKFLGEIIRD